MIAYSLYIQLVSVNSTDISIIKVKVYKVLYLTPLILRKVFHIGGILYAYENGEYNIQYTYYNIVSSFHILQYVYNSLYSSLGNLIVNYYVNMIEYRLYENS